MSIERFVKLIPATASLGLFGLPQRCKGAEAAEMESILCPFSAESNVPWTALQISPQIEKEKLIAKMLRYRRLLRHAMIEDE